MAGASGEGGDYGGDAVSAEARALMEEDMHLALLTIAQSVPYLWPTDLDGGRRKSSSICVAGQDYELACLAQRPTITLRLRNGIAWEAARPGLMEMRIDRPMFPTLSVRMDGLISNRLYTIFLDLMPKDQNVYEYQSGLWASLQTTKPYPPPNLVRLGSALMECGMDFSFVKITADTGPPINRDEIFVHRGQIYLPRYHIVRHLTAAEVAVRRHSEGACRSGMLGRLEYVGTYVIPETEFVAVSSYQNRQILELKLDIDSNPCGFRGRRDSNCFPN
ncbi:T-box brain protein 1 [Taenia solium]|eukprot:TsM_000982100 transcript=TsM_000982100 gene=TsM_000982100